MSRGIRNVLIRDCTFIDSDTGIRFKSAMGRGGTVEDIYMRDILMVNIQNETVRISMDYVHNQMDYHDPVVQSDTVTFVGKINDATTLSLFRSAEYPHSAVGFELFKGEGLTNAESDYIVFVVDKTTGEFRSEGNRLQPETTYTYRAFVNLTGDKRVYSENSITFKTARYDGDLVIPDAKKRQSDLDQ